MTGVPLQLLVRFDLVLAVPLALDGCVSPLRLLGSANEARPFRDLNRSMQYASDAITIGQAFQSHVLAALGPATVVKFDGGLKYGPVERSPLPTP